MINFVIGFTKTEQQNSNIIVGQVCTTYQLSKDAYSLYLRQTPKEKAELMKLLTIELLFDGKKLIITPHSAFSALLNLRKSYKLELTSDESNFLLQKFVDTLSDEIFICKIMKYKEICHPELVSGSYQF